MAGILVEYARFVEVQQRRARAVAQLMRWPGGPFLETNDDHPFDIDESRRLFLSRRDDAARRPDCNDARIP